MIWKKKSNKDGPDLLAIDFEMDRRNYFRVTPDPKEPVYFHLEERKVLVEDISAGGLALNQPGLPTGRRMKGELWLPGSSQGIQLSLLIVRSGPNRPTSCSIEQINERDREVLHQYVLNRQKVQLNEQKKQESELRRARGGKHP